MLALILIEVREYVPDGRSTSRFADWFLGLDTRGRELVDDAVARMRSATWATASVLAQA